MSSKLIIVNSNDVTDEMETALEVCEKSPDNSKTVFRLTGDKPSCFNAYNPITQEEFHKIRIQDEPDIWHPIPSWAVGVKRETINE